MLPALQSSFVEADSDRCLMLVWANFANVGATTNAAVDGSQQTWMHRCWTGVCLIVYESLFKRKMHRKSLISTGQSEVEWISSDLVSGARTQLEYGRSAWWFLDVVMDCITPQAQITCWHENQSPYQPRMTSWKWWIRAPMTAASATTICFNSTLLIDSAKIHDTKATKCIPELRCRSWRARYVVG